MMEIILKYFPELDPGQKEKIAKLEELYNFWNDRINVISRKDIGNLYEKHVLHSLSIARLVKFAEGTKILDAGTGGGFPGLPLAIMFPEVTFHLVDSVGKKINVVRSVANDLSLQNILAEQNRLEQLTGKYDFVTSRSVAHLQELVKWTSKNISTRHFNAIPNGFLCLKGGDLDEEIKSFRKRAVIYRLSEWFTEFYFEEKKLVYIPF